MADRTTNPPANSGHDFWDRRYSREEYVYGENPNQYLEEKLTGLAPGRILLPAEGEGRNAVFAAKSGWKVSAFDPSGEGKRKADLLAEKNGVLIDYLVSDIAGAGYPKESFDALALIYAHLPAENRKVYHLKLAAYLKKGGVLLVEGFEKRHAANQKVNPGAGGPRDAGMLYDLEELKSDFPGFEFLEARESEIQLNEGACHQGKANVVRIFAVRK